MASTHKVWVEIAYDSCWWLSHKRKGKNESRIKKIILTWSEISHICLLFKNNRPNRPFPDLFALYSRRTTGHFSIIFKLILENRVILAKLHHLSLEDPADQWLYDAPNKTSNNLVAYVYIITYIYTYAYAYVHIFYIMLYHVCIYKNI